MKDWWRNLSDREKLIVGGGGSLTLLLLVYLFIWSPFISTISMDKNQVKYQRSLLIWMKQADTELKGLAASGASVQRTTETQLLSVVDASLKTAQLNQYASSIGQSGAKKVLIKFKQVPFDSLIKWLAENWKTRGIKVTQISVTPDKGISGIVDADVFLGV